ncbi:uncharacterized protein MELLADRAFT_109455 [Melampsora larici-populina 98AG31]|uniref:Uncharacterized protein n=1 Tax=Melampsora larici-populina (strain 98AG31 / pathotype 3-4-7) TaxID=747676 RepID=F4RWI7_MELLP|nr:uncharacterized protein MELLADRAFT_109455 [Melampsora larici-populina 98AG31]EGG03314.1 hypothetical protein MELLADRAFT_109455 [Melampsora larici-populina 98AG31]
MSKGKTQVHWVHSITRLAEYLATIHQVDQVTLRRKLDLKTVVMVNISVWYDGILENADYKSLTKRADLLALGICTTMRVTFVIGATYTMPFHSTDVAGSICLSKCDRGEQTDHDSEEESHLIDRVNLAAKSRFRR